MAKKTEKELLAQKLKFEKKIETINKKIANLHQPSPIGFKYGTRFK